MSRGARRRSAGVEPRALERIRRRRARQSRGARRAIDTFAPRVCAPAGDRSAIGRQLPADIRLVARYESNRSRRSRRIESSMRRIAATLFRSTFPARFSRSLLRHTSSIRSFDTLLQDASSARFVEALARSAPRAPILSRGPPPNGAPAAPAASQPPSGPHRIAIGRDTR
ncbi:hypothetical protein DPR00_17070 [Burkholderia pseudomallei]|uniref:Uncharacterized protein n=2 Tax=Burkholderia pseudomallei TaxID=28450 RepID=A0AAX0UCF6_BURPE|nr:conserved hypothetical protein [Burkholderia pseudomallei 1106a]AFR18146.1 hypothetical protein BPC006_II0207 [Burkholderia pseudomallei BPC006]ARK94002.1 hypothetical protein BOC43_05770 [Burkholderia pseudomallei]EES21352.1 conserved hypothetical protein [Burkholderia pseudomallei 1106b]AUL59459.1 hypothetical protein BHT10_27155 [Burkholderia pseudomallei]